MSSLKEKLKLLISKIGFYFNKDIIELNTPVGLYKKESIESSYNFFKKYFIKSVLFSNVEGIRKYCIDNVITNLQPEEIMLEFGVYTGESINFFSSNIIKKKLKNKIYGFDTFQGLNEDWNGSIDHPKNSFDLNKKLPQVNSNIELIQGKVEITIGDFLDNIIGNISFVHFDLDLYSPTKFALQKIKKRLKKDCILLLVA